MSRCICVSVGVRLGLSWSSRWSVERQASKEYPLGLSPQGQLVVTPLPLAPSHQTPNSQATDCLSVCQEGSAASEDELRESVFTPPSSHLPSSSSLLPPATPSHAIQGLLLVSPVLPYP